MDGGDFSNSYGNGIINTNFVPKGGCVATANHIFNYNYTGNIYYDYISGIDGYVNYSSGDMKDFFRIDVTNSAEANLDYTRNFTILPSTGYTIHDSANKIIYLTKRAVSNSQSIYYTPFSGKDYLGRTVNGEIYHYSTYSDRGVADNFLATYYPNEFNPPQHVLYVYNTGTIPGRNFANYYFNARTGLRTGENYINTLAVNCLSGFCGEMTDTGNYVKNIRQPIWNWLIENKKPIRYICLLFDIPTRITGMDNATTPIPVNSQITDITIGDDLSRSLHYFSGYTRDRSIVSPYALRKYFGSSYTQDFKTPYNLPTHYSIDNYLGQTAMVCNINFGSLTNTSGYINKLLTMGIVSGIYIRGSGQNNVFVMNGAAGDDPHGSFLIGFTGFYGTGEHRMNGLTGSKFYRDRGVNFEYQTGFNDPGQSPWITGGNLIGFVSAGSHSWDGILGGGGQWPYASNYCSFNGYNWFITVNAESYGGRMFNPNGTLNTDFGNPASMMLPTSFSGTNYRNCPVGFAGSCLEPGGLDGIENITYIDSWIAGYPFIDCCNFGSYISNVSRVFCGDPFVMR